MDIHLMILLYWCILRKLSNVLHLKSLPLYVMAVNAELETFVLYLACIFIWRLNNTAAPEYSAVPPTRNAGNGLLEKEVF